MIVIPLSIGALLTVHLWLVAKLGTTAPPWTRVRVDPELAQRTEV